MEPTLVVAQIPSNILRKQTSLMKPEPLENVYDMIEHAIEYTLEGRMQLKFYEFLNIERQKGRSRFILNSSTKKLSDQVLELKTYIRVVIVRRVGHT